MKRFQQHDVEIIYQCHLSDGGVMFPHTVHTVSHIFFTSTCSSYAVYYYRPIPLTRHPFISPRLFLPSLPHFTWRSQRSPVPTPSWIELSHPSLIFTFFCASHLFPTMVLSFLVELSRSERKKTNTVAAVATG